VPSPRIESPPGPARAGGGTGSTEIGPPLAAVERGSGPLSGQIIRLLLDHPPLRPEEVAPFGMTQTGLAERLGRPQGAFARVLQRLEASGVVASDLRHVAGANRRQKVYQLTPRGREIARNLARIPSTSASETFTVSGDPDNPPDGPPSA
jgi:DNA-binding MarR family transcriptional regulator